MYAAVAAIKPTPKVNRAIFMAKAEFNSQVAAAAACDETVCATLAIEVAVKTPLNELKRWTALIIPVSIRPVWLSSAPKE
jgi:hypothetical protein